MVRPCSRPLTVVLLLWAMSATAQTGPVLARSAADGAPSESTRALYAQRMVPLLDEEQGLLREKLAMLDAKKAQLRAPYDEGQALALRERERDLQRRFQNLYVRRKNALGTVPGVTIPGAAGLVPPMVPVAPLPSVLDLGLPELP